MRLKTIPKGTKIIKFTNPTNKICALYWNKKPFLRIAEDSFIIIKSRIFFCGIPLKEFPEFILYSNVKIEMDYK